MSNISDVLKRVRSDAATMNVLHHSLDNRDTVSAALFFRQPTPPSHARLQVVIVDDSYSMTYKAIGECSRWELACDTLQILAELASDYDDDGVDVFFLNSKHALKVI